MADQCCSFCSKLELKWNSGSLLPPAYYGVRVRRSRFNIALPRERLSRHSSLQLKWGKSGRRSGKSERISNFQQPPSPTSHFRNSSSLRFFRGSSKQLITSTLDVSESSSPRLFSPSSLSSARTSLQNPDSELFGASQAVSKSSSAAVLERLSPGRSSSVRNAVLPKSVAESSEDFEREPRQSKAGVSRSSGGTSRSPVGFPDSVGNHPIRYSETVPDSRRRVPYFEASNASYKAQVLRAEETKLQQAVCSSGASQSSVGAYTSSLKKTVRTRPQTALSQPKTNPFSPVKSSKNYSRSHVLIETSPLDSSRPSSASLDEEDTRRTDANGSWTYSGQAISPPGTSPRPESKSSSPDASSARSSATFSSRSNLSGSLAELSPGNSGFDETRGTYVASEREVQRISSPLRSSRVDLASTVSSFESLDRLHQRLEEQAKDYGSKAILQRPLGPEEVVRLRDRLKEQKDRSMQEIQRRLFQNRISDGHREDGFSCAIDPDSLILGEFVVHKKVGVGKYIGMKSEVPPGKDNPSKYIYLKYADGIAKLKAKQAQRLLYRYHLPGETGRAPSLSKLKDPGMWEKRKSKGKIAVQKMVVNMMELYIHRLKQSRPPYSKNGTAITEFAAQFPHTPTPDQLQAFADVQRDMTERDLPMDRLICGDVGFGKTEVALRALFIAVASGKQAMVLTPSTVLAKQHYETVRERFASFPFVKVALLCRFQKDSEKKDLILGIHDGSLNIVVGTHALLGNQIRYHNLGLLVIDEEQRFGVKQKEKITCLKTSVDVLTLSATPIPRTLYLAMNGFRDASILATPPPERRPIQTHLIEYSEGRARAAIQFELDRGGQVFYVVPKIKGIEVLQWTLQSQFPGIEVAVAHGKQPASTLEEAMERFCEGKTKILLCTNIIESGLDIKMVNTIIVEDVHLFGLAQLYQLRGRVGRAQREAHAYLFHPNKSFLTDEALERLVALQDCCDLGQGFQLAERDMAIRGIGSLFGEQQSGDAAKIGTDLYFEMLLEGLSKVDSQRLPQVKFEDVQLELGLDAHIPSDYIRSFEEREAASRNAERAAKESLRALMLSTNRLRERYGKEPTSMEILLKMVYVRRMAADLGIHRIRTWRTSIMMETTMNTEAFEMIVSTMSSETIRSSLTFQSGYIEMQGLVGVPQERQLERIFCCLADMVNCLPSFVKYI